MHVFIGHDRRHARLDERDVVGAGGEARVFRHQDHAIKIFHAPADEAARRALRLKLAKIDDMIQDAANMPPEVVAPGAIVTDAKRAPIGYAMPLVIGAADVARLAQRSYRDGAFDNAKVAALFRTMHRVVGALHARRIVVGDLNDANVLFRDDGAGEPSAFFIDADSMQVQGHRCTVAHERFLDPRLFGKDLSAAAQFDAGSDWFAFATMLFASLLYTHPFGGVHRPVDPAARPLPTALRRAEARHSVFHDDVAYPRAGVHWRVLDDDLAGWFERVFDRDERAPFPAALLASRWTRCACGTEHARATCPACTAPSATWTAMRSHGRCTARRVLRTRGRVLAAAVQGGLRYVYEEDGKVLREDGAVVLDTPRVAGMRFVLAGASTWIVLNGRAARVERGRVVEHATFGAFAASAAGAFVTQGDYLVDVATGSRVGSVLDGQTWIASGPDVGFGFYRAGAITVYFVFRPGRAGLVDVKLPPLEGRLVDVVAHTDGEHVLFATRTEVDGRATCVMHLVAADGRVIASHRTLPGAAPNEGRMLASIRGKALFGGRVVTATDDGVLALRVENGRFVEATLFPDAEPFVGVDDELLPAPGGGLYVVSAQEILHLTLS